MAQATYRANLNNESFPLLTSFQGRTVIQPQLDQHYYQRTSYNSEDNDKGIPVAYYLHNVLPSSHGFKSISYKDIIASIPEESSVNNIIEVTGEAGARGIICTTLTGKTYLSQASNKEWIDVTPSGVPQASDITYAITASGTYICYGKYNIYFVDLTISSLIPASIVWDVGVSSSQMLGITGVNNYLISYTESTVYWSSALDVLDMQESLATGAGFGTPTGIIGEIKLITPLGSGFAVYCKSNIVLAAFSGNTQYPWLFRPVPNSTGITELYHVVSNCDDGSNYAWTSSGLLKLAVSGVDTVFPEVTEFIAGRVMEDYDTALGVFTLIESTSNLSVKLSFLASRYLAISYGINGFTHALVYDLALKRWGKLKLNHEVLFNLVFDAEVNISTYYEIGLVTYDSFSGVLYDNLISNKAEAPSARHSMAAIDGTGKVSLVIIDFISDASDSVIFFGKYQLTRSGMVSIEEIELESVDSDSSDFTLDLLTSVDGLNTSSVVTPYNEILGKMRKYYTNISGLNHTLRIKGTFHLNSLLIRFSGEGRT